MVNTLKVSAWCGILAIIASFIPSFIFSGDLSQFGIFMVFGFVSLILWSIFAYGFFVIGKRYKSNFLKVITIIGIVLLVVGFFVAMPLDSELFSSLEKYQDLESFDELSPEEMQEFREDVLKILSLFLVMYIFGAIFLGAVTLLSGVALFRLRKKVKHAKTAGILKIIAGATYIIFIGFIFRMIAFVFELIIMFQESEKKVKRKR